ncbi:MAG: dihydrofolate reductase [Pseudomonadota bacterium]
MVDRADTADEGKRLMVSLVVAAAENDVIGAAGRLPWRMPSDLKLFRRLTIGKPVIMGRKTFAAIGKPLEGRVNIVLSRSGGDFGGDVVHAPDVATALEAGKTHAQALGVDEIMIIGGSEIYTALLPYAEQIYLTRIQARPDGDTMFPTPTPEDWVQVSETPVETTERDEHGAVLIVYRRRQLHPVQ